MNEEMAKKRCQREMEFEMEASEPAVLSAIVITKSNRNERGPDEPRNGNWWANGYQNWDQQSFNKRLRVSRDTFEFILGEIKDLIVKEATRMKPNPVCNQSRFPRLPDRRQSTSALFLSMDDFAVSHLHQLQPPCCYVWRLTAGFFVTRSQFLAFLVCCPSLYIQTRYASRRATFRNSSWTTHYER